MVFACAALAAWAGACSAIPSFSGTAPDDGGTSDTATPRDGGETIEVREFGAECDTEGGQRTRDIAAISSRLNVYWAAPWNSSVAPGETSMGVNDTYVFYADGNVLYAIRRDALRGSTKPAAAEVVGNTSGLLLSNVVGIPSGVCALQTKPAGTVATVGCFVRDANNTGWMPLPEPVTPNDSGAPAFVVTERTHLIASGNNVFWHEEYTRDASTFSRVAWWSIAAGGRSGRGVFANGVALSGTTPSESDRRLKMFEDLVPINDGRAVVFAQMSYVKDKRFGITLDPKDVSSPTFAMQRALVELRQLRGLMGSVGPNSGGRIFSFGKIEDPNNPIPVFTAFVPSNNGESIWDVETQDFKRWSGALAARATFNDAVMIANTDNPTPGYAIRWMRADATEALYHAPPTDVGAREFPAIVATYKPLSPATKFEGGLAASRTGVNPPVPELYFIQAASCKGKSKALLSVIQGPS